ncbi:TPA: helix-turn-helix domain-containing protein [Vibrio parahaemolyticus]
MSHTLVATLMKAKTGSPISKLILLKLADNADIHGRCFPSYQYLARYCEISLRTVKQHIRQLESIGFVELVHRFDKRGRQQSNLFQIHIPAHLHVELECETTLNCTRQGEVPAPSEEAGITPIISHKETDLLRGGQFTKEGDPVPARMVDRRVAEFAASGQPNPFEQRIALLIEQKRTQQSSSSEGGN